MLERDATRRILSTLLLLVAASSAARAQNYNSGSTGADGALTFPANAGVVVFRPQDRGLDPEGDHVFHFTTINVPAGTTVRLGGEVFGEGRPLAWLATGAVVIDGVIDLNGGNGHAGTELAKPSAPGAGGHGGGSGGKQSQLARIGGGPGGGRTGPLRDQHGGSGGNLENARSTDARTSIAGTAYGSPSLLPMIGGSGGGGGDFSQAGNLEGGGGGAGGGALVIASSTSIAFGGTIAARGGDGGSGPRNFGGGGSGGAVRMVAPVITGAGAIDVRGGRAPAPVASSFASAGRIRLEALDQRFTGTPLPTAALSFGSPAPALLPATAPRIRVAKVGGVAVTDNPTGSVALPDVTVDFSQPVSFEIEAANVPLGIRVTVNIVYENGSTGALQSGGLAGTLERSTAMTVATTFQNGIARVFLTASW